jgi:hypothetical protein
MEIATRRTTSAGALFVALLGAPVLALAQGPVLSFDQLDTRLRLGATVYVSDAQGREITGKIQSLAPDALTLDRDRMFAAPYVSAIHVRQRSHAVRNGALIGVAAGVGLAAAYGHAYCPSHDCEAEAPSLLGLAEILIAGSSAAIGAGVGHLLPGAKQIVYRAPGVSRSGRLSLAPLLTPRTRGVALSLSF